MSQDPYSQQRPPEAAPYTPQNPYAPQDPYTPQNQYPPQQQGYTSYPPQGGYPQQPPPGSGPYPGQGPYQAQYPYGPQVQMVRSNPRAKNALIYGFISLGLSILTVVTLAGFAGLITGTFAIVYGVMGLNTAKQLPNNAGRGQAMAAIGLGIAAWVLVIFSYIIRHGTTG